MEYRICNGIGYLRLDRGDGVIASVLEFCRREGIRSATFSGLGGCDLAEVKTFDPETKTYGSRTLSGMLELASLWGDVTDDGNGGRSSRGGAGADHRGDRGASDRRRGDLAEDRPRVGNEGLGFRRLIKKETLWHGIL